MTKIAAIQMCSSHELAENLAVASKLIKEAANNNAELVVLPEMFAMMGLSASDKVKIQEKFGDGQIQKFLSEESRKNKTWIVGGTIPLSSKNKDKVMAASLVYDAKGNNVARYDKIHLFDVTVSETEVYKESDTTESGDKIVVIQTPVGKLGLAVCYDVRFPELFRTLFKSGAEIISLPSAFTVKTGDAHWEVLCRSRAIENLSYIVGSCQGGTHTSGRKTYGNSLIIDPWGSIVSHKNDSTPGVVYADIDLDYLHKMRKSIPVSEHQKIFYDSSTFLMENESKNTIFVKSKL